jgi:hypothetical protein
MNKTSRLVFTLAVLAAVCPACLGNLGKPGPAPQFLRLNLAPDTLCPGPDAGSRDPVPVALGRVTSLPGLDRTAVLFASGPVLEPSTRLFWEGTPTELVALALDTALECAGRPGEPLYRLAGTVHSFEVDRQAGGFRVVVVWELGNDMGRVVSRRPVTAQGAVSALDAAGVARGADRAMTDLVEQTRQWLDSVARNGGS